MLSRILCTLHSFAVCQKILLLSLCLIGRVTTHEVYVFIKACNAHIELMVINYGLLAYTFKNTINALIREVLNIGYIEAKSDRALKLRFTLELCKTYCIVNGVEHNYPGAQKLSQSASAIDFVKKKFEELVSW